MAKTALSLLLPQILGHKPDTPEAFLNVVQYTHQGLCSFSSMAVVCQGALLLQRAVKQQQSLGPGAYCCLLLFSTELGCFILLCFCNPFCSCLCYGIYLNAPPPALTQELWFSFSVIS